MPREACCNKMLLPDMDISDAVPYTTRVLSCRSKTNRQSRFSSYQSHLSLEEADVRDLQNEQNNKRIGDSDDDSVVSCGKQGPNVIRTTLLEKSVSLCKGVHDVKTGKNHTGSNIYLTGARIPSPLDKYQNSKCDFMGRRVTEIRVPPIMELDQVSECFSDGGRITDIQDNYYKETAPSVIQSKSPVSPSLPELILAEEVTSSLSQDCRMSLPLPSEEKHYKKWQRNTEHRSGTMNTRWSFKPWSFEVIFLSLTLLCIAPVSGGYDRGGFQHQITWGRGNSPPGSAVFGNSPVNVTAVLGHRARLPCQVKNLGLKDVSWIRQRDLHILTVGIFTYTSDDRFKVFHPHETEDWYLDISSVTFRDSGTYECQVSTSPKVSLPIYLTVLGVQEADIPGPDEVFIQHGSTISLQCEVQAGVEAVGPVHWLKGADTLNYSSPRGGISMEVEKTPTKTMSKLYITRAVRADSGNYTCAPLFAKPDSVLVHVVNAGEESAAAVHSGSSQCEQEESFIIWAATLLPVTWLFLKYSSSHP